jgi:hypothetical protein
MSVNSEIRDGLISLFKGIKGNTEAFSAEVTAVDIPSRSCTVLSISSEAQLEYTGVWLMPQVCDGILYVPKVGSTVIVENNKNLQPYVVMWSELDQVMYVVGHTTLQMTSTGVNLDGNVYGGVPMVQPLLDKINRLENKLNDLVAMFNTHTHPVTGTAPSGGGPITLGTTVGISATGSPITPTTVRADLENTKVQHGAGA